MRHAPLGMLLVAVLSSACAFCAHRSSAPATVQPITIVYSTALVGALEPCGCSPDQRGGIAHAAATIDAIRKEGHPVLVLDGGDRFFPPTPPPADDPMLGAQQRLDADAVKKATEIMKYDAVALGTRDAWAGADFFKDFSIPLLDTSGAVQPFSRAGTLLDAGGLQVGVLAVGAGPDAINLIRARAESLRSQGARMLILLAYQTFQQAQALLPAAHAAGIALVLAGRADDPETHDSGALPDSDPPLFTVRARGEALLRLDLMAGGDPAAPFVKVTGQAEREADLSAMQSRIDELRKEAISLSPLDPVAHFKTDKALELEGRKAKLASAPPPALPTDRNSFTYAFVAMSPKLPEDSAVRAVVDDYNGTVAKQNLAYAQAHPRQCPRAQAGKASFVGDKTCIDCHQEAYDFWKTTPHAHAYADLSKRNRQYDATCIRCHVTGYEQPGGACDIAQVKGRENVQCEACHGAGSLHSEAGDPDLIPAKVTEQQCRTCHDPENSPHFNFATYRPQIIGPGHGVPPPAGHKKKG